MERSCSTSGSMQVRQGPTQEGEVINQLNEFTGNGNEARKLIKGL